MEEKLGFTAWLFNTKFTDPEDPVTRFQNAYKADINWPMEATTEAEFVAYLKAKSPDWADTVYTLGLAWKDYQKYLLT